MSNFLVVHISEGILLLFFNFFDNCLKVFLCKLSKFDVELAINNFFNMFISGFEEMLEKFVFFQLLKSFLLASNF